MSLLRENVRRQAPTSVPVLESVIRANEYKPSPSRGAVRFGSHERAEAETDNAGVNGVLADSAADADRAAAAWPPLEQDDTSDELHELPWWAAFDDVDDQGVTADGRSAGPGARLCSDVRDRVPGRADDAAVVQDALREAAAVGLISPAEAAELWPVSEPHWDNVVSGGTVDTRSAVDVDEFADGW